MNHLYALIMAGGGGTRLWPLSRRDSPKQNLPLTEERTLFQVTVDRLNDLLPPDRVYVVTGESMAEPMRESVPQLPEANFVIEPSGRDSGPAAGLGLFEIAKRDPNAVVAILSADHHIADENAFRESLRCAAQVAEQGYIVTLGIQPSYAATGFGYIQRAEKLSQDCEGFTVYRSKRFAEKPDAATAELFVNSGEYYWNGGIFILKASTAIAEFERQRPQMYATLKAISDAPERIAELWPEIEKRSIDFAIMEGAQKIAVIPVDIGWSDVGTWATLLDVLASDDNGNAARGEYSEHIQIDTVRTLIVSNRLVVTIGVSDLVIVETPDAVLVCHKDRTQDVKEVVNRLKMENKLSYL